MSTRRIISYTQYVWMLVMYIMGSAAIIFIGGRAEQDVWVAIILGLLEALLLCLPFLLLAVRFPGMGVSKINDVVWGNWLGKLFTLAFIWYTMSLASVVGTNFQEFTKLTILVEIPEAPLDVANIILLIAFVLYGIENIGRYTSIVAPLVITLVLFVTILSIPYMDYNNIRPPFHSLPKILTATHGIATFPLSEIVAFSAIIPNLKNPKKAIRYSYIGLVLGAFLLLTLNLRNLLVLGQSTPYFTYPSYTEAKIINVAGVFTRMELLISINHTLSSILKAAILTYAACITTAEMLNVKSIRTVAIPIVILISLMDHHNFPSVAHNVKYAYQIYPYYALPFQFGLPFTTLIASIIKRSKAIEPVGV